MYRYMVHVHVYVSHEKLHFDIATCTCINTNIYAVIIQLKWTQEMFLDPRGGGAWFWQGGTSECPTPPRNV